MRLLFAVILTTLLSQAAYASRIFRHVDENGRVYYSDKRPTEDAEAIEPPTAQGYKTPDAYLNSRAALKEPDADVRPVVRLSSPADGTTVRDTGTNQPLAASVEPPLHNGQQLVFYHNGKAVNAQPVSSPGITVSDVFRGTHNFSVAVVSASGRELARSESVTIYKKPPIAR